MEFFQSRMLFLIMLGVVVGADQLKRIADALERR